MRHLTTAGEIRARLRALRLFVIALRDERFQDLDSLLSVAESEAERMESESPSKSAKKTPSP